MGRARSGGEGTAGRLTAGRQRVAERLRALPDLRSLSACMFGFAFVRAWDDVAFDRFSCIVAGRGWVGQDLLMLAMIATFGVCTALARRIAPLYEKRGVLPAATCLLVASSVATSCAFDLGIAPAGGVAWVILLAVALTCGGAGAALSILLWAELQSCFNSLRLMLYVSGAFFLGALLGWLLVGLEGERLLFATLMLPLLSAACLRRGFAQIPKADLPKHAWGKMHFPWALVATLGIYEFVFGLTHVGRVASVSPVVWGTLFAAATLFVTAFLFSRTLDLTRIYRTPFVLMVCGLLVTLLSFSASGTVGSLLVSAAYAFMFLVLTVLLCDIAHRYGISAIVLCGIQELATVTIIAGDVAGTAMEEGLLPLRADDPAVVVTLTILVVVASVALVYSRREAREWSLAFFGADEADAGDSEEARLALRCAEVGERYGLSPREREVLLLFAQGKTTAQIGRELCIANGTNKSHAQRIYTKLGVHSRKDVLALLDVRED